MLITWVCAVARVQVPSHLNVVGLVGVVTDGSPKLLVMAYCENGALASVGALNLKMAGTSRFRVLRRTCRGPTWGHVS